MPGILLCGAEGEQFLFENELSTMGADDKRRGSVQLQVGQQMYRQFDQGYNDFWVHYRCAPGDLQSINFSSGTLMEIRSGTDVIVRVFAPGSGPTEALFRPDVATSNGGALDSGPSFPHALNEFINYDIRVVITTTTSTNDTLTVYFYRNEVLRHSVSYTDGSGWGLPNAVLFQPRNNDFDEDDMFYQDIVITDALPTVGMELATLVPSAVGSYSDFNNDYTAIDDRGYDQSSVISTTNPGDRESWFFADPEFNLGDKVIYGVALTTVAQTDLAGFVTDFEPFVRINAVNYPEATIGANNVAPNAYTTVFTENPSTSAPWLQAELVGLESGIRAT